MTTQTEAQRLAAYLDAMALDPALCHHTAFTIVEKAAAELLRLEAANAELLAVLVDVSYTLEKARIWGGMEWKYNPLHPVHYLPARDKARAAIKKHGGAA